MFHAELADASDTSPHDENPGDPSKYLTFLESRPQQLEVNAIKLITEIQAKYSRLRCHIVHLSAAHALPLIRKAKAAGLDLTIETCFHYLCLASDKIPDGRPEFKCCPPVRDELNRDQLWEALEDGTINFIVSDHSPCVRELKLIEEGDIMGAWGGISTLGLGLSLLWTEGRKRGVTLAKIVEWTSRRPAEHAGIGDRKGQLKVGYDGDVVVWDSEATFEVGTRGLFPASALTEDQVTRDSLHFKNKITPYLGQQLQGVVEQTYVRGLLAYDRAAGGAVGGARGVFV
jgi:allantoinase